MDGWRWIESELRPRPSTSDQSLYERMASQSMGSLPVVYQPFDPTRRCHWADRGAALDFLEAAGPGGRWLDFGPGDGWPSLLIAPYVESVTGVDASARRIHVCEANAARLGIRNFRGVHVPADQPLPFGDESFDAVAAASSLEQTPDPPARLRELYRVLRTGGRLRIHYEALSRYGGQEREGSVWAVEPERTVLHLIDRRIAEERATYYNLWLAAPVERVREALGAAGSHVPPEALTAERLDRLRPLILDAATYELRHPGCRTWMGWLTEAGFRDVRPTHDGGAFAGRLFESIPEGERPTDMAGVDRLLRPVIRNVVRLEAPEDLDPPITAVK